ncbi:MAG: TonB-dependent receptor, partial [Bacteroidota bacterium]
EQEEDDPSNLMITDDTYRFSDFSLKFLLQPSSKHTWTLSAMRNGGLFRIGVEELGDARGLEDEFRSTHTGLGVNWQYVDSDRYQVETSLSYADARTCYRYQFQDLNADFSLESLGTENEVRDWTLEQLHRWKLSPRHQLGWGAHLAYRAVAYSLDARYFGEQAVDESFSRAFTPSLFVQHLWRPRPQWELQTGLRYSRHSLWERGFLDPRLTVRRQVGKYLSLRASLGVFRQYVVQLINLSFDELNIGTPIWALVDEDDRVPVLRSVEVSLGATFERKGWLVDLEAYHKDMSGLSTLSTSFQENLDLAWDAGDAQVQGLDLLVKRRWPLHQMWVAYTLSQVLYQMEGLHPDPFPAPHDQRHNLKAVYLFQKGDWEMAMGWNYSSGRPFTPALGTLPAFEPEWGEDLLALGPLKGNINSARLPAYHRLDLSVGYAFSFKRWARGSGLIRISLLNLLDR